MPCPAWPSARSLAATAISAPTRGSAPEITICPPPLSGTATTRETDGIRIAGHGPGREDRARQAADRIRQPADMRRLVVRDSPPEARSRNSELSNVQPSRITVFLSAAYLLAKCAAKLSSLEPQRPGHKGMGAVCGTAARVHESGVPAQTPCRSRSLDAIWPRISVIVSGVPDVCYRPSGCVCGSPSSERWQRPSQSGAAAEARGGPGRLVQRCAIRRPDRPVARW